jgi:hypothetical protein
MAIGVRLEPRSVPCCTLFGAPLYSRAASRKRQPRGCCVGGAGGTEYGDVCSQRGDRSSSQHVAYARTYASAGGIYRRQGVLSTGTTWSLRGSRRRDTLPTHHETDFSVLEFAAYQADAEYSEFVATSQFASAASDAPTSLRQILDEFLPESDDDDDRS